MERQSGELLMRRHLGEVVGVAGCVYSKVVVHFDRKSTVMKIDAVLTIKLLRHLSHIDGNTRRLARVNSQNVFYIKQPL
jgi:hypothetical protein